MTWTRILVAVMLLGLVGVPLALPAVSAFPQLSQVCTFDELGRLAALAKNTLLLVGGTLLLALPVGTMFALLLFRTNLPLRRLFLFLLVLAAFVPLSVLVSAWQATLGPGSWLPVTIWAFRPGQPWTQGLLPAIWVHALAAVPWVALIVGQNLRWVERELEEEALLSGSSLRVILHVALPRCWAGLVLAALWVAFQTTNEISVTDMFDVRTFAEETYRIFSEAGAEAVNQAVLLSLPPTILFAMILGLVLTKIARTIPPVRGFVRPALLFSLGNWRWPAFGFIALLTFLLAGIPLVTLFWRAGLPGTAAPGLPPLWSLDSLRGGLLRILITDGDKVGVSLIWSLLTACATTLFALLLCWCAREPGRGQRCFRAATWAVLAAALAVPGPIVGVGLKQVILRLIVLFPDGLLAEVLYFGPSPAPMMWAWLIRTLPWAVVVLWPVFRLIPPELDDAARLEGASAVGRLRGVLVPLSLVALATAVLVAFGQAVAEVGASKLATTPGVDTFTLLVFDRMHYGVAQDVASLCLLLLSVLFLGGVEMMIRLRCLTAIRSSN